MVEPVTFDYKKYSLQHLDEWVHDALNCDEITPQEIYNTISDAVDDSIEYHRNNLDRGVKLLSLLKGYRPTEIEEASDKDWEDFWEPLEESSKEQWAHPESSLYKNMQYTEEEMDAMCERAATENDKEKCREYNLREAEYYTKRAELDAAYKAIKEAGGYEWTPLPAKKDKVVKWTLPVQQSGEDYFIEFPNDLLEAANLQEGDTVEWVDREDGSYELRKVCPACPPCETDLFSPE